jgi:hypothetical protein
MALNILAFFLMFSSGRQKPPDDQKETIRVVPNIMGFFIFIVFGIYFNAKAQPTDLCKVPFDKK